MTTSPRRRTKKDISDSINKLCEILQTQCIDVRSACVKADIPYQTLRNMMMRDESLTNRIIRASTDGADQLVESLKGDVRGKIFLLSRVYAEKFGKQKEENLPLNIPPDVIESLQDDAASVEDKIKIVNGSLLNGLIGKLDYDFLMKAIKNQHPLHFKAISQEIKVDLLQLADKDHQVLM